MATIELRDLGADFTPDAPDDAYDWPPGPLTRGTGRPPVRR